VRSEKRSGCPISLTLEVLGDKWSLIVIRDIIFGNRRHFRELLTQSEEGIASNILANRLQRLVKIGIITKSADKTHRQKVIYNLTEAGIQLLPVLVQIGAWGRRFLSVSEELSIRAEVLEKGGPRMWAAFMSELRELHLGQPRHGGKEPVGTKLQKAYEEVLRQRGYFISRDAGAEVLKAHGPER
jgi:DNA-binding HxlR family transcriptional regulator